MIDTLAIAKKLRGTKLDPADAETIAEVINGFAVDPVPQGAGA